MEYPPPRPQEALRKEIARLKKEGVLKQVKQSVWDSPTYKFRFVTCIDLVMGFYGMKLSERPKQLYTIILAWEKWQYQSIPMSLASAPNIFQTRMGQLFQDMESVIVYMNDLLIIGTEGYEKHI